MHLELPLKIEEPAQILFSKQKKSKRCMQQQQAQNLTPLLKKEHAKNCNFAPAINLICTWMFKKWKIFMSD